MSAQTTTPPGASGGLKKELKVTDAAAFSIGLIGPVGVMALLGADAAGIIGRGATWAFIFALVAVSLVAYGFVRLSRYISHTGSVYALVGLTLGPRAGFVAGWLLFLAYVTIGAGSTMEVGYFLPPFLDGLGWHVHPDWIWASLVVLVLVAILSRREVHVITRSLLFAELIGAVLVTVLSVVVLVRLGVHHAPAGRTLSWQFLHLPTGAGFGTIGLSAVVGFLAFAGFEGAATLGEETTDPRRDIPRAFKIAIVLVGAFYLLSVIAQSLGYGTSGAGVKAYVGGAPYNDLGRAYVGAWMGDILNLAGIISLFAISLGTLSGAARVLFALGRDAGGERGVARLSPGGAPTTALSASIVLAGIVIVVLRLTKHADALSATFDGLQIGTLALLVAYILATIGAVVYLFFSRTSRAAGQTPRWQVVFPLLGLVMVVYTLYRNVVHQEHEFAVFPWLVLAWLLVGLAVSFAPGLADRVRTALRASDDAASTGPAAAGTVTW